MRSWEPASCVCVGVPVCRCVSVSLSVYVRMRAYDCLVPVYVCLPVCVCPQNISLLNTSRATQSADMTIDQSSETTEIVVMAIDKFSASANYEVGDVVSRC